MIFRASQIGQEIV